jgi:hypothetical protein
MGPFYLLNGIPYVSYGLMKEGIKEKVLKKGIVKRLLL